MRTQEANDLLDSHILNLLFISSANFSIRHNHIHRKRQIDWQSECEREINNDDFMWVGELVSATYDNTIYHCNCMFNRIVLCGCCSAVSGGIGWIVNKSINPFGINSIYIHNDNWKSSTPPVLNFRWIHGLTSVTQCVQKLVIKCVWHHKMINKTEQSFIFHAVGHGNDDPSRRDQ